MAPNKHESTEPYIVITCEEAFAHEAKNGVVEGQDPLWGIWGAQGSAKFPDVPGFAVRKLKEIYPKSTVVAFSNVNIVGFPGAYLRPLTPSETVTEMLFFPLARQAGQANGIVVDHIRFGSFRVAWDRYEFVLYTITYPVAFGESSKQFLVHDGSDEPIRGLLRAAGTWTDALHEEIYVYNQGFWYKDHAMWEEIQKANWDDVILKDEFKSRLQKDVVGFFDSEELYRRLSIPWKRGVIMHGPPGNGKTISMKAIMKDCDSKGYYPLYVKSFRSWKGEEGSMADVFDKARQVSPCVVILEDLDSLINASNRSFFLNQIDGLENNDGLLVIGTTNHLENIDPALRSRPSRFDRKFLFDDPDSEDRKLYIQYWQNKLKSNKSISFPDSLVDEVVDKTDKFSFAYLKEAFVSTLVILAGYEERDDAPTFAEILLDQIKTLRKQLGSGHDTPDAFWSHAGSASIRAPAVPYDCHPPVAGRFGFGETHTGRRLDMSTMEELQHPPMPGGLPPSGPHVAGRSDMRQTAMAVARLGRSYFF